MEDKKNIGFILTLILSLFLVGTIGYKLLLDVNLLDALYMTVITISTVGYAEIALMDEEAKIFSIILILISLSTVGYLFSSIVRSLLEGDLKIAWRQKKMERDIKKLENHYIICGAGETGMNAIRQFQKANVEFLVIEKDEDTVLTARSKNENLYIVSRAIEEYADDKLKRAGANNTISPNEIGGSRMAALMLRPTVISFLDVMTHAGDVVLDLEDVEVLESSSIKGKTLREVRIPEKNRLDYPCHKKARQ